jgi:hypothetical protein
VRPLLLGRQRTNCDGGDLGALWRFGVAAPRRRCVFHDVIVGHRITVGADEEAGALASYGFARVARAGTGACPHRWAFRSGERTVASANFAKAQGRNWFLVSARCPARSFEVVGPIARLVQAGLIDAFELRRPVIGQEVELALIGHDHEHLALADDPRVFPPLRIQANFVPTASSATVTLSAIFRAPDITEKGSALGMRAAGPAATMHWPLD